MSIYSPPSRGYWKITLKDIESIIAENHDTIIITIDGSGAIWEYGAGKITINKGSAEWEYLFNHIVNLNSFKNDNENTNSKKIPMKFRNCFSKA
jgi:hypothetical protein